MPEGCEKVTKPKVNYLRAQGIVSPKAVGAGGERTSWRYDSRDVRGILVAEMLKSRESMGVKEIKGWLHTFDEGGRDGLVSPRGQFVTAHGSAVPPTPMTSARTLMCNRALGIALNILTGEDTAAAHPGIMIAIRASEEATLSAERIQLGSWEHARQLVMDRPWLWFLGVTDSFGKLYVYRDSAWVLEQGYAGIDDTAAQLQWHAILLHDGPERTYQCLVGVPEMGHHYLSRGDVASEERPGARNDGRLELRAFPGLATLFRAAFLAPSSESPRAHVLSVLAESIARSSDAIDYCAILMPDRADDGRDICLRVRAYSSDFPTVLVDRTMEIGQFLSGWSFRYGQSAGIAHVMQDDPRIGFWPDEHPTAALAMPAISHEHTVCGVVYVARQRPISGTESGTEQMFSEEFIAYLKLCGFICGDVIARDQVEVSTVRAASRLSRQVATNLATFEHLSDLLDKVVEVVKRGVVLEKVAQSWIYMLTLSIHTASQDVITDWLDQQVVEFTTHMLGSNLWDTPLQRPLPIAVSRIRKGGYVIAILAAIDLPEEKYKQAIMRLRHELDQFCIGRLSAWSPEFYPWAVTTRYDELRKQLSELGPGPLMTDLAARLIGTLDTGPYINRGHDALRLPDLDRAVSEFEDALRYTPMSWYVHKHLAEARMLQGTKQAITQAVASCREAIRLSDNYASAHCLLADCLSYQGEFEEALIHYERAVTLDPTRTSFLIRYGASLASMTTPQFLAALEHLKEREPGLVRPHTQREAYLAAIDKFDLVRDVSARKHEGHEQRKARFADYHYQRGYAFLQAGLIGGSARQLTLLDKAIEEFAVGRKYDPSNLELAQGYLYALSLKAHSNAGRLDAGRLDAGQAGSQGVLHSEGSKA